MPIKGPADIREDAAVTITIIPEDGEVWSTPAATVRESDGSEVATPTVTASTISTTVGTVTSTSQFTVASATGISAGTWLRVTVDGVGLMCQVERIDSTTVYLVDPLPLTPATSDTVQGIELTLPLTAANTATRARNYTIALTDGSDTSRNELITFHVVKFPFPSPLTAHEIRELIHEAYPADSRFSSTRIARIRDRMRDDLRAYGLRSARYVDQIWDRELFRPAAEAWLWAYLARHFGLVPVGRDPAEFVETESDAFRSELGEVFRSIAAYAEDDDHTEAAERFSVRSIRCVR